MVSESAEGREEHQRQFELGYVQGQEEACAYLKLSGYERAAGHLRRWMRKNEETLGEASALRAARTQPAPGAGEGEDRESSEKKITYPAGFEPLYPESYPDEVCTHGKRRGYCAKAGCEGPQR